MCPNLIGFDLEEVNLPQPVELEIRGRKELAQSALRLTITSGANLDAHLIWIDDASLKGVWGAGGEGVATFITDRSILRDGAVISISHDGTLYDLLATKKKVYLRHLPIDPMTGKADWLYRSSYDANDAASWGGENVFDVHSAATGTALNGQKYVDW